MTNILFICHGNICRSPMAEFIMKDIVEKAGVSRRFFIASAATSAEEIGNPVYPVSYTHLDVYKRQRADKLHGAVMQTLGRELLPAQARADKQFEHGISHVRQRKAGKLAAVGVFIKERQVAVAHSSM